MKIRLIIIFFAITAITAQAQDKVAGSELKKHMFVGGSFGLQFGTVTNIEVAPDFGYYLNDFLSLGLGASYQFYGDKRYYPTLKYNIYGGRAFLKIHPIRKIIIHAEYELLGYKTDVFSPIGQEENILSENILIGAAYRESFSPRFSTYILIMYNLNQTIYTPYSNPVFRFGLEYAFPLRKKAK